MPTLVDGKHLKSINQGYNKKVAVLKSKLQGKCQTNKRIQQITFKWNKQVEDSSAQSQSFHCIPLSPVGNRPASFRKNPAARSRVGKKDFPRLSFLFPTLYSSK